jgi:hypothetical protein
MAGGGDIKKGGCPHSAQAFLKLDAWCESTRGLNLKRRRESRRKKGVRCEMCGVRCLKTDPYPKTSNLTPIE